MAQKIIVGGVGASPIIAKINASAKGLDGAFTKAESATLGRMSEYSPEYVREIATISKDQAGYKQVPIKFTYEEPSAEQRQMFKHLQGSDGSFDSRSIGVQRDANRFRNS